MCIIQLASLDEIFKYEDKVLIVGFINKEVQQNDDFIGCSEDDFGRG